MDLDDEKMDAVDLQIETVDNREKYTVAIHKLLEKCSKLKIKSLETEHVIEKESKTVTYPELNVPVRNIELDILNKKLETDVKNDLKEQIRMLMILNKKMNCPISQRMDKL